MTVIQVLPALEFGGVERGTLEIANQVVRQGHRSIVISAGGQMLSQLQNEGSEHLRLAVGKKSPLSLGLVPKLRSIFSETRASIVHARSRFPAWLCYLALKNHTPPQKPRFVTTVHGIYSVNKYSSIMTKGEKVIAISKYVHNYIVENYPEVDPQNISVIPRGVDPEYFSYNFNSTNDWKKTWFEQFPETINKKLITLPGRITRRKGHEDFLDILKLLSENQEIHGVVVGGPHKGKQQYLEHLKQRACALGLSHRITFAGHRNDIREIISLSQVVLSLSIEPEAFGRSSIEALSLGVPVVAYNHGGSGEVLNSIFQRGLVATGDVGKTSQLIQSFINDPPRVLPQQTYTLQAMQKMTLSLYESLV